MLIIRITTSSSRCSYTHNRSDV